jgi:hypothetical protein
VVGGGEGDEAVVRDVVGGEVEDVGGAGPGLEADGLGAGVGVDDDDGVVGGGAHGGFDVVDGVGDGALDQAIVQLLFGLDAVLDIV